MILDPAKNGRQRRIVVGPKVSLLVLGTESIEDALIGHIVEFLDLDHQHGSHRFRPTSPTSVAGGLKED